MKIRAKILPLNRKDLNGRTYPTAVGEEVVRQIKKNVPVPGALSITIDPDQIEIKEISHHVINAKIENNTVIADIETLNTPAGRRLEDLLKRDRLEPEEHFAFGVGSYGSLDENGIVQLNGFQVITIDLIPIEAYAFRNIDNGEKYDTR